MKGAMTLLARTIAGSTMVMLALPGAPAAAQQATGQAASPAQTSAPPPAGQRDPSEGKQSTSDYPQEATRPGSSFPAWYLKSTRNIDPRVRPNAGLREAGPYTQISGGPVLYPNWSPVEPDFLGGQPT